MASKRELDLILAALVIAWVASRTKSYSGNTSASSPEGHNRPPLRDRV